MNILVVFPGEFVRNYLNNRTDIVYLDEKGWWILKKGENRRCLVDLFSISLKFDGNRHIEIIKRLRELGPIWARWVAHADQYELVIREALIYVLYVQTGLAEFGINKAIFHTSVSHHIDSSLIEIACSEAIIPQIFLYAPPICYRLIPMIQYRSIADRKPFKIKISEYKAVNDLNTFLQNKLKGTTSISKRLDGQLKRNSVWAEITAFRDGLRHFVERMKGIVDNKKTDFFDVFPKLGFSEHLRLIQNQKKGLEYYDKNCISPEYFEQHIYMYKNSPLLLIAAHYQPESTSFPEGGEFNNHVDIVIKLRSLGYQDIIIYKEHPSSYVYYDPIVGPTRVGLFRSVSYYKRLKDLGCMFVRPEMELSLNEAENDFYLPVTITGTIGVERSLTGFSTIYTGHPWYKDLPGSVYISDTMKLLQCEHVLCASKTIADDSFDFLNAMLSNSTIINVLGIASGVPRNDKDLLKTFIVEFNALIDSLKGI